MCFRLLKRTILDIIFGIVDKSVLNLMFQSLHNIVFAVFIKVLRNIILDILWVRAKIIPVVSFVVQQPLLAQPRIIMARQLPALLPDSRLTTSS
jgi:hypothetical protein